MRSSRYHDYKVLKIAIFVILVIVGLLLYINLAEAPHEHDANSPWTVVTDATCTEAGERCRACACGEKFDNEEIPATGHDYRKTVTAATCTQTGTEKYVCRNCNYTYTVTIPKDSNNHNSTTKTIINYDNCTEGGSKDVITYCTRCNKELSKETVMFDHQANFVEISRVNQLSPTHTVPGSDLVSSKCSKCEEEKTELVTIDAVGHTYSWELVCTDKATATFAIVGKCNCNEAGNVVTLGAQDGVEIEDVDPTVMSCCEKEFKGTVTYGEEEITVSLTIKLESHRVVNATTGKIADVDDIVSAGGRYFDYNKVDSTYGNIKDYVTLMGAESFEDCWDYRGLAFGYFYCIDCGKYYSVRIYNADFDTTI